MCVCVCVCVCVHDVCTMYMFQTVRTTSSSQTQDHPDSSSPVATSTPETSRRLSLRVGQSDGKYSTSDIVSVDPRMFIMMDFQVCENVDSKFVGYTIQVSTGGPNVCTYIRTYVHTCLLMCCNILSNCHMYVCT